MKLGFFAGIVLLRDAMYSVDCVITRCLSVRLSHASILLKWLCISSDFLHHRVATPF